ncbi:MAG: DUF2065 domain-containing protein [Gammaproteobacteria bacterium]|nr:DUF2065 domain-containing protein [Gammaproteobacteria bacterium]
MLETVIISAIALVFVIEGLLPFVFPRAWQKLMLDMASRSEKEVRFMGLTSLAIGMVILLFLSD